MQAAEVILQIVAYGSANDDCKKAVGTAREKRAQWDASVCVREWERNNLKLPCSLKPWLDLK